MSLEDNKALVRRFYEALIRGDEATLTQILDRNVSATFLDPSHRLGFADVLGYGHEFRTGFPDGTITIDDIVAEGEKVAVRGICSGTHKGEFEGLPPTGKGMAIQYHGMFRIVNGKIVEFWEIDDMMTMMQQLGALPSEAAA